MIITYNQDGTILITPETENEQVGIAYEFARRGSVALKLKLEEHYKGRYEQRNFEASRSLNYEISTLSQIDQLEIVAWIRAEIARRKNG